MGECQRRLKTQNKKHMEKIDNIKNLWSQLGNNGEKTEFIRLVAKEFDRSPNTINNHWFARFWNVPSEHQDRVIELLQNTLKLTA